MDPGSPLQSPIRSPRSRSGSRTRRHRSPRSPIGPGGDTGRSGRYYDDEVYSRAPTAYRDREPKYSSNDYRPVDTYPRGGPPMHGAPVMPSSGSNGGRRSRSRSPMSSRRRHGDGDRENPPAGRCIGIFGLSIYTKESDILDVFSRYGPIDDVQIVYDAQSGRSRGFAFVYFQNVADAAEAKERCNGIDIDGRKIRVDFSLTQRAHTPTPGIYMGKPHPRGHGPGMGMGPGPAGGAPGYYPGGGRGFNGGGYPAHRSSRMHNPYPPRGGRHYPPPHTAPAPPVDYARRRGGTRSRSTSPRKYYY